MVSKFVNISFSFWVTANWSLFDYRPWKILLKDTKKYNVPYVGHATHSACGCSYNKKTQKPEINYSNQQFGSEIGEDE